MDASNGEKEEELMGEVERDAAIRTTHREMLHATFGGVLSVVFLDPRRKRVFEDDYIGGGHVLHTMAISDIKKLEHRF